MKKQALLIRYNVNLFLIARCFIIFANKNSHSMYKKLLLTIILFHLFTLLFSAYPKREMRAVWIATVTNLDWPSKKGLSTQEQQDEMIRLLDEFKANNINTVVFQARPCADVYYKSEIEPWSMWLSGKQGVAPYPYYDPLEFVIEESHKRCMEVHAWINPYRALNYDDVSLFDKNHIFFKKKDLFVKFGNKYYFNPGLEETQAYLNTIVKELVEKYDIDAVHFDDYFYPYPIAGEAFPDNHTFKKHPRGFTHKNDWRRDNVTEIIKQLNKTIKKAKPWVEFGISPFGVWRHEGKDPRGSATQKSLTNYDDLYADVLKWLKEDYIDYVVPQLYWEIGKKNHDYKTLVEWWSKNSYGKNLYIGLFASGFEQYKSAAWQNSNELIRQLELNKKHPNIQGVMFFSAKTFIKNYQGLNTTLKNNNYKYPALVPINNHIQGVSSTQPKTISFVEKNKKRILTWNAIQETGGKKIAYYVIYAFKGKEIGDMENPQNIIAMTPQNEIDLTDFCSKLIGTYSFVVTTVNKYKHESEVKSYLIKKF